MDLALKRASEVTSFQSVFKEGVHNAIDMVFGVLPVVMGLGTVALVIAEYTPVFEILGQPFIPYLELLQIPEAVAASQTIVVGFADMFIPAILAASIDNEMTRFVIAAMSVTQLIYMSEVGALLLGSKIGQHRRIVRYLYSTYPNHTTCDCWYGALDILTSIALIKALLRRGLFV